MSTLTMTRPNDKLAAIADYLINKQQVDRTKKRHYSETLGEYYGRAADGSLVYDDGVTYTRAEQQQLKNINADTKIQIHNIKKIFTGATLL